MSDVIAGFLIGAAAFFFGCVTIAYCSAQVGAPWWLSAMGGAIVGIIASQLGLYYVMRRRG